MLLAGQANSREWWDPIRADFAAGYRTIAVDAVGTGDSGDPRDGRYGTRRFAGDVVSVLDALGVARAHLHGTSMGGKSAQWLAVDHPERVGALVLGCTSPGGAGGVFADREVVAPLRGTPADARDALPDLMFTPEYLRAHTGPFHVLGEGPMSTSARRGHRRAGEGHGAWDELGRIQAPTLVVHGSADLFCPVVNAERLASRVPGAETVIIEGGRHGYFEEFRAQAGAAVLSFLARHPLDARAPRAQDVADHCGADDPRTRWTGCSQRRVRDTGAPGAAPVRGGAGQEVAFEEWHSRPGSAGTDRVAPTGIRCSCSGG